mmetsp:Transcript_71729/g.191373  ORF Transcript_71729/g.191373 Transcript_71729/m.191373 type:complete len:229 (-) Transcript_71729:512-1198(-)
MLLVLELVLLSLLLGPRMHRSFLSPDAPLMRQLLSLVRYAFLLCKVGLLLGIELVVFPLCCGWLLDFCALPVLSTTWPQRLHFAAVNPFAAQVALVPLDKLWLGGWWRCGLWVRNTRRCGSCCTGWLVCFSCCTFRCSSRFCARSCVQRCCGFCAILRTLMSTPSATWWRNLFPSTRGACSSPSRSTRLSPCFSFTPRHSSSAPSFPPFCRSGSSWTTPSWTREWEWC